MNATRAVAETVGISRTRGGIKLASLSATPDADSSPRAYLNDALGYAVRKCGGTVASIESVVSGDLTTVPNDKTDQFFDLFELRILETCLGNWTKPAVGTSRMRQDYAALFKTYRERVAELRDRMKTVYQVDSTRPSVGTSGISFTRVSSSSGSTSGI